MFQPTIETQLRKKNPSKQGKKCSIDWQKIVGNRNGNLLLDKVLWV